MVRRTLTCLAALWLAAWAPIPAAGPAGGPLIRIRVTTAPDAATVECDGGLRVLDLETGAAVGPDPFGRSAIVVTEDTGRSRPVYRAQVASLTSEEEARDLARSLGRQLGVPARVHYHADRRAWRVRVGEAGTAEELDGLVARLADLGHDEVWVTLDSPESRRGSLRLVDARWNDHLAPRPAVRIVPAPGCARIAVGERTYRGVLEARIDRQGRLALINELPMEQYLRGVVPNELGPALYPEVEALKAQTVAARTYAWRNLGQFGEDGYDLCDTPRCQVYKGAGTEHPLTDRAIRETAGLVAVHDGEPIHALYSSTCGGHTEDGANVFPEETGAYLRGVPCYAGHGAPSRWVLTGRQPEAALQDGGAGRDLYLLASLDVLDPAGWDAARAEGAATADEARDWIAATLTVVGKGGGHGPGAVTSRTGLARELVRALGWEERARLRVAAADVAYLLDFPDAGKVPRRHRTAWALLLKDGLLEPFPDGTLRPDRAPGRTELARTLAGLVEHYDAGGLTRGSVRGLAGDSLRLEVDGEERELRLPPDVRLLKDLRGRAYPVARMEVLAGDKIAFRSRTAADGVETVDYAEVRPSPKSASDDRFTTVYEWEVRLSLDELTGRLSERVRGIGRLVDLEILGRGKSDRVTALRVIGTSGTQVIRGFPIRTALGLREIRFAIDRQRDEWGNVRAFIFTGKGWGHGVGMCQVGAYGMALRGAGFRDILLHYYTGISLEKAYP